MISRGQMYRQLYYGGGEGIASLDAGAPSIKYKGDIKPRQEVADVNLPLDVQGWFQSLSFEQQLELLSSDIDEAYKIELRKLMGQNMQDQPMQDQRQMVYKGGRMHYGLGSIFKGVKKAVKGIGEGISDLVKSDVGKAAILGLGAYGLGGGFSGNFSRQLLGERLMSPINFLRDKFTGIIPESIKKVGASKALDKGLDIGALLTIAGGGLAAGLSQQPGESTEDYQKRLNSLIPQLRKNWQSLNPIQEGETPEDYQAREDAFISRATREYSNKGGRIGYALGDTAQMAAGIEGLPLRQNPAGISEIDMRETGGFIPPVGIKEKADDIPAMLSNNEFVFTADAVRGMGDGDVELGSQRMYDMMKKLEKGGRV